MFAPSLDHPVNMCFYFAKTEIKLDFKDLYSTAPKRGSVFIGLMTPDGAIWSRYQRTITSLLEVIKGPLKGNIPVI